MTTASSAPQARRSLHGDHAIAAGCLSWWALRFVAYLTPWWAGALGTIVMLTTLALSLTRASSAARVHRAAPSGSLWMALGASLVLVRDVHVVVNAPNEAWAARGVASLAFVAVLATIDRAVGGGSLGTLRLRAVLVIPATVLFAAAPFVRQDAGTVLEHVATALVLSAALAVAPNVARVTPPEVDEASSPTRRGWAVAVPLALAGFALMQDRPFTGLFVAASSVAILEYAEAQAMKRARWLAAILLSAAVPYLLARGACRWTTRFASQGHRNVVIWCN